MDKRTLIAVVLSVAVVATSFIVQQVFFKPAAAPTAAAEASPAPLPAAEPPAPSGEGAATTALESPGASRAVESEGLLPQTLVLENDVMALTLDNAGAVATSIRLKTHQDQGRDLEMVNAQGGPGAAFELRFGSSGPVLTDLFRVTRISDLSVAFERRYLGVDGAPFRLIKTFSLKDGEYLVQVDVTLQAETNTIPRIGEEFAYTLSYGPQMGPSFQKLGDQVEFRKYSYFFGNDKKEEGLNNETKTVPESNVKWAAMTGKYFMVAVIPDGAAYRIQWSNVSADPQLFPSRLILSRPALRAAAVTDSFRWYVGPKDERVLARYNTPDQNAFGIANLRLDQARDIDFLLGWLQDILKFVMSFFYGLIPNWGVAVVLLTLSIRALLWIPTHNSYKSTAAMSALSPKLKEIQDKYKNDPQKLNAAMAELYKKEGVNPLGGCLPMLLQLPIFFALYGMLNTHFDLRGAVFIPGWITDLSLPESIWNWGDFRLPFLGWNDLRALPILMVVTQVFSSMFTSPSGGAPNAQTKMLTYLMPVVFFFMLYDMPSGLLVYWVLTNILSMLQQMVVSAERRKQPAAVPAAAPARGRRR